MKAVFSFLVIVLVSISAIGAPNITSFTPDSGSVGTLVTITGTNLSSPTAFTIGGVAAIVVSNNGTTLVGMVMPGAVTGPVTVTTASGTASGTSSFAVTATPHPGYQQGSKLVGTGAVGSNSNQGNSIALSADGNTAIVGAPTDNSDTGAVWIYIRRGNIWTQQGSKLVGTGAIGAAKQGQAVAISANGNTAIVGGWQDNSNAGAAWVYTRTGSSWTQQGSKLVGAGAIGTNVLQGKSVAISADGNTAIVGGDFDNYGTGAVWVYTRTGSTWTQQGSKLLGTGAVGASSQGYAVALSADGNTAIVGGYDDNSQTGALWIFTRTATTWSQQGSRLVGTGTSGGPANQGSSVAISADGNTIIEGGDLSTAGDAWIFTRTGTSWTQQGSSLVGTGAAGQAYQGYSVGLTADGNTAIVGGIEDSSARGAAWVYTRTGSSWTQQGSKLVGTGAIGSAYQGSSVALSADGQTAIVGGYRDSFGVGAAWVYVADSIRTCVIDLSISVSICPGSSYILGSTHLTQAGTYHDTLTNGTGCDSIVTLQLSVYATGRDTFTITQCAYVPYPFDGHIYTQSGYYTDTLRGMGSHGCDSLLTLHLLHYPLAHDTLIHSICAGDTFIFGSQALTQSGWYKDTLGSMTVCDTIYDLHLLVNNPPAAPVISRMDSSLSAAVTPGLHQQWQLNGTNLPGDTTAAITITQNGTYTLIVTDANGCSNVSNSISTINAGISGVNNTEMAITLQPNPALSTCTISMSGTSESCTAHLLDLSGREVSSLGEIKNGRLTFPVSPLGPGIYLVRVADGKGKAIVKKLVVE